jgi:hypothetical protein
MSLMPTYAIDGFILIAGIGVGLLFLWIWVAYIAKNLGQCSTLLAQSPTTKNPRWIC